RQGRIKAGSEFILSTVLGVISTGKGGDSGTVVGVNGNNNSGHTSNVAAGNQHGNSIENSGGPDNSSNVNNTTNTGNTGNVVEGETGTYGDSSTRSVRDGMTPDHIPSFASVRQAVEDSGVELSQAQIKALRDNTNCVVVKTCDHQSFSRTYGGRNNQNQIQADANDLRRAADADLDTWEPVWRENGWSDVDIQRARQEVHN